MKNKPFKVFAILLFGVALASCGITQKTVKNRPYNQAESCMVRTLKGIDNAIQTHSISYASKTAGEICRKEARISGFVSGDMNLYKENLNYQACMRTRQGRGFRAPRAYEQYGRVLFAVKNLNTVNCPVNFKKNMQNYISSWNSYVNLAKKHPKLETRIIMDIVKGGSPANQLEADLISGDANLGRYRGAMQNILRSTPYNICSGHRYVRVPSPYGGPAIHKQKKFVFWRCS